MTERVEVRDLLNTNRMLGTMSRTALPRSLSEGLQLAVAVPPAGIGLSKPTGEIISNITVRTIRFELRWFEFDGGWSRKLCYATMDKLADLMDIRDFRLPEETKQQFMQRHWYRRY